MTVDEAVSVLRDRVKIRPDGDSYSALAEAEYQKEALDVAIFAARFFKEIFQSSGWIDVNSRLPERPADTVDEFGRICFSTTNRVLIATKDGVDIAYFEHQGCPEGGGYFWRTCSLYELKGVTHWMPLPPPPGVQ